MLIWFMNKIYLFFILVCCVQSYLLPFSCRLRLRFSLPLIKITARIDRPQTQRNWQRPGIEIHQSPHIDRLTSVWLSCFLRGQVCCTDYWKQNGVHVTVCLGLNFRLARTRLLEKKKKKQNSEVDLWKV